MARVETDATQLSHFTNYPVCGFCMSAWDIIYGRMRSMMTCAEWLEKCKWGGCDPDVWDYLDDRTGWPWGWKVNPKTHRPRVFEDLKLPVPIPDYDDRVYHMRKPDYGAVNYNPNAPWRKVSEQLRASAIKRNDLRKKKGVDIDDPKLWEDEEITDEDLFGPNGDEAMDAKVAANGIDLDADDLWD